MIPILSYLLYDNETLFYYERDETYSSENLLGDILRRLTALERSNNVYKSNQYYEGLKHKYTQQYTKFYQLFCDLPQDLAENYICTFHNKLYIHPDKFNGWMDLISQFPPLLVISAYYLNKYSLSKLDTNEFHRFVKEYLVEQFSYTAQLSPYLPDLENFVRDEGGLCDLHIHLNGATETDVLWNYLLEHPLRITNDLSEAYKKELVKQQIEQIIPNFTVKKFRERIYKAKKIRHDLLKWIYVISTDKELPTKDCLETRLFYKIRMLWGDYDNKYSYSLLVEEAVFYLSVMNAIRVTNNDEMAARFHHYLLIKGLIHRIVVQQKNQISFSQFEQITQNNLRCSKELTYTDRFLQLLGSSNCICLKVIEGRFSPKETSYENRLIVKKIIKGFEEAQRRNDCLKDTRLTLIAHFIKEKEVKQECYLPIRNRLLRQKLYKRAIALSNFIKTQPQYGKYIVGVDAAANEMYAGPEVFSPTFRYLRRTGVIDHITYHVGEDFNHIISGVRFIVEALEFLELRSGDRLGHCTAIGLDPKLWMNRVGDTIFISQGEWLDDLIVMWHLLAEIKDESVCNLRLIIERKIEEFSYKIYQESFPPYLLFKQWKSRKYDPLECLNYIKTGSSYNWSSMSEFEDQRTFINELTTIDKFKSLYLKYHESSYSMRNSKGFQTFKTARDLYEEIIEIKIDEVFSSGDICIIQNYIINQIASKGIVIETLPTSNLRISYYERITEYHLDRWIRLSDSNDVPPVVIGTDDPGIFMTNIYNEYSRTYIYLKEKGYDISRRMLYLSNLNQYSKTFRFKKE